MRQMSTALAGRFQRAIKRARSRQEVVGLVSSLARHQTRPDSAMNPWRRVTTCANCLSIASPVEDCPEKRLAISVFQEALRDIALGGVRERRDAETWIRSESFEFWCGKLGICPDYSRELIQDIVLPIADPPATDWRS